MLKTCNNKVIFVFFADEGFLRMSRGGEAFGRRPPPPPLILNPPHLSTQPPPRQYPTPLPFPKDKGRLPSVPPQQRSDQISASGEKGSLENVNSNLANRNHNRNRGTKSDVDKVGSDEGGNGGLKPTGPDANGHQSSRGLEKDVNGVFSKVSQSAVNGGTSGGSSSSSGDAGTESDAHPLLGITPAAPGEAFDFNPILSNPAVTRILAGSSGRIPQWEPALPDLHGNSPMNINTLASSYTKYNIQLTTSAMQSCHDTPVPTFQSHHCYCYAFL